MKPQALIVIDLQNGVNQETKPLFQLDEVIQGVNERIAHYRQLQQPILFVQHVDEELVPRSYAWQLFDELDAQPSDYYIEKTHANAFYQTQLADVLQKQGVTKLEICGAQVEYCVDTTIRMAHGLGYKLFMKPHLTTTCDNEFMNAETTRTFFEGIWQNRFVHFI